MIDWIRKILYFIYVMNKKKVEVKYVFSNINKGFLRGW